MKESVAVLLCVVLGTAEAAAQPVQIGGAEVAWSAPQEGAILEVGSGLEKAVSLRGPRRLPARGWLVARVRAGDPAWVHLDGDPEGKAVRFAFLTGGVEGAAAVEAVPERRGPGDFVFRSPIGPQTRLGLRVLDGKAAPRAQIWIGAVQSPGFRWELWEQKTKAWAARLQGPPPAPPDLVGEPLVDRLALVADAVTLAQAESPRPAPQAAAALLTAEALLANQLSREPLFPYFRRYELTRAVAGSAPVQKIEDQRMFAASAGAPVRFTVDGPGFLRIEARARFADASPHGAVPLQLLLRANGRLLAVGAEEVLSKDPTDPGPGPISSRRRIVVVAAPGRHTYELQLSGGPAWLGVIMHTRVTHAEDLASHGEDIQWLLRRAGAATGLVAELLSGEASFLGLQDERARAAFARVAQTARSPRLRAFARLRLAALAATSEQAAEQTRAGLALLDNQDQDDEAAARLRNSLVARHLTQVVGETPPGVAPPAEAVALFLATPGALPEMLAVAGPLLRHVPGPRSLALPILDEAQRRSPLNVALRHFLAREWFTGTRWASLPAVELAGALPTELLTPPLSPLTCAEARNDGARAYAPLAEQAVTLEVPPSLAPPPALRRFSLVALRRGAPRLGWAELLLDGEMTRLPLVLQSEPIPLALAAGRHTLRAVLGGQQVGALLGPCELRDSADPALLVEHHFSALVGRGAQVQVAAPEPGTPGFFGLELRVSPELRGGRLLLRTERGILGRIELDGHGLDPVAGGRALGPALSVALPLPADAQAVDIIREDDGAPLLVRALLRRSLAKQSKPPARLPVVERTPQQLELLRQATRALRKAQDDAARARARLGRAELLIGLNALTLARHDLDRGLPSLKGASALAQARELLTSATELPLLVRQPSGRAGVILAAGANLAATAAETACVSAALARFAVAPQAGLTAIAGCPGLVGLYAAARLEEQSGRPLRAAQHYAQAYLQALDQGLSRPALARQAARQYAERGPGPGSKHGLALATAAVQDDDPEGARALGLVRGLAHSQAVRAVDAGESVRLPEGDIPPLSLHAALADVPWAAGMFLEARGGRTTETDFQVKHPLRVRVEALCDDQGEPVPEAPPCNLRLSIDGTPVGDGAPRVLSAGQRARLAEVALEPGAHRIQITLARQQTLAFFHFSTSRPLGGAVGEPDADGFFAMPITAPPTLRFTGSPAEPVQLRVQGPTVLRIDALAARGAGERALRVELTRQDKTRSEHSYPLCKLPAEQPVPATQPGYSCRSQVAVPLVFEGTYQVRIVPVGTPAVALALAIYDDEPPVEPSAGGDGGRVAAAERAEKPGPAASVPALRTLKPPESNLLRGLGTLQVQQLGIFGSAGRSDPQIGDTFAETSITYRRRLEGLPLWLRAGSSVRLREGPATFGLQGTLFGRIPVAEIRVYADLQGYTQLVEGHQEYSLGLRSYLERSIKLIPHLFLLPRFAFTASYQSLAERPKLAAGASPTPIDLLIFNQFDAAHPTGIYGQMLLWWVPFINMISYAELRLSSNRNAHELDGVRARAGLDMAFHTTELILDYQLDHYLVDDARKQSITWHSISAGVYQTLWLNRNHRLGLTVSGNVEVLSQATTFVFGAFWEGSRGRGLDDYATPEINLPQQLSQGRGYQRPEETYR